MTTLPIGESTPFDRAREKAAGGATLREILTIGFRDWRRIAAAFLLGLLATGVAFVLVPKSYTAEASLLLRLGREYVYTPEVGEANTGAPIAYDREQTLLAESKILTSRDIKESVLKKMGVEKVYPKIAAKETDPAKRRTDAVLAMEKALDADLLKGSNLLQVSFKHPDAEMSAQVLAQLIDAYMQKRMAVFANATYGTAEADFAARTVQLNQIDAKTAEFKRLHGIRSFAEEQTLLLAQRNAIEQRQTDTAFALAQANGRARALRGSLGGVSSDVTLSTETQRSEAADSTRKLLLDLKLKERDLSAKFADTQPAVEDVRADIARASAYLRELDAAPPRSVRTGRSPARDVAESDLIRTVADRGQASAGSTTLAAQRAAIDQRLADLATIENDLRAIERERRLAEANYDGAAKRLRDEMVVESLDKQRKSNVSVVQSPLVPLEAKSLRPIVLIVGLFASLCLALLVAFLSALWRDTFLTPEDVQRTLKLPLLGSVPRMAS